MVWVLHPLNNPSFEPLLPHTLSGSGGLASPPRFRGIWQKTAGKLQFQNWIGARGASCPRTAPTRGCSRVARRGPTIGHRPMHRTLPETSPVVLALLRGLNPPVTPALASSAPAAGPIFYHFRATERHLCLFLTHFLSHMGRDQSGRGQSFWPMHFSVKFPVLDLSSTFPLPHVTPESP